MFVRRVKRKCGVRGCKNTDCFAISRTREAGGSVIICRSCLGEALGATNEIDPKTKSNIPAAGNTVAPSLFFNAAALGADTYEEAETSGGDNDVQSSPLSGSDTEDGLGDTEQREEEFGNEEAPEDNGASDESTEESDTEYVCPKCGKTFTTERGLNAHMRTCKVPTAEASDDKA